MGAIVLSFTHICNARCDDKENRNVESLHNRLVYGRVQGVGFRYTTQHEAQRLGLTGYAKNMDDGSVEVVACGESDRVEQLMKWLKAGGPRKRGVDRVLQRTPSSATN